GSVPARAVRPAAHSPPKLKREKLAFSLRILCAVNEFLGVRVLCSSDLLLSNTEFSSCSLACQKWWSSCRSSMMQNIM
ncbi:hypothetical protein AVEN_173880-1, partial [Araneus ventricosus]